MIMEHGPNPIRHIGTPDSHGRNAGIGVNRNRPSTTWWGAGWDPIDFNTCYLPGCPDHDSPAGPPVDPRPNSGKLRDYHNKRRKWDMWQKPRPSLYLQQLLWTLYGLADDEASYLFVYWQMERAGMCYFEETGVCSGEWRFRG